MNRTKEIMEINGIKWAEKTMDRLLLYLHHTDRSQPNVQRFNSHSLYL